MSETKTETILLRTPDQAPLTSPLVIEAAGKIYRAPMKFVYLGSLGNASADIMGEIKPRVRLALACYERLKQWERSNHGSDSHWHATNGSSRSCTIWRVPRSI